MHSYLVDRLLLLVSELPSLNANGTIVIHTQHVHGSKSLSILELRCKRRQEHDEGVINACILSR